jgi:serine/threonine protein phosphatase PrpC
MRRSSLLKAGVATDPGQRRTNNEDLSYVNEREGLFAVVDGIGGEVAGEEAARMAVDAIQFRFKDPGGDTEERIREAIALANNRIYQATQDRPELSGMSCVLTLAVVEGRTVTIGHVGDSRLYRVRNGRMEKITLDHSPVGDREDRGEITEAEAMSHPRRNEVYRDVGSEPHQPGDAGFIDIFRTSLPPDAALLISSDGLTDMVPREEMLRIVETYEKDPNRVAQALVDAANAAGGKDNITVVFVPGSDFAAANGRSTTRRMGPIIRQKPHVVMDKTTTVISQQPLPRPRIWLTILGAILVVGAVLYSLRDHWSVPGVHLAPATLHVGKGLQYASITAALAEAQDGDSIVVAPGVYAENVLLKSGIALLSSKSRQAEIRAGGTAVNAQTITGARISGFRIGSDSTNTLQIGVMARDAALEVDDSEISGASDAGLVIQGNSTARLANNFIHDNAKAGVRVESTTIPDMQGNHICDNGTDIVPASTLAADANNTGSCVPKPAVEKPRAAGVSVSGAHALSGAHGASGVHTGASGAHKGRRHE